MESSSSKIESLRLRIVEKSIITSTLSDLGASRASSKLQKNSIYNYMSKIVRDVND